MSYKTERINICSNFYKLIDLVPKYKQVNHSQRILGNHKNFYSIIVTKLQVDFGAIPGRLIFVQSLCHFHFPSHAYY